jgi:Lrp/AsnC family leucine-responsive transcriptional regulator
MDRIDREILGLVAHDGRLSFREIGAAVHLSANAVAERFRRLRATGAIRHIRATLDFETALRHLPQVVSATLMTGAFDYSLRVACTDRDELMQLTETLRRTAGVRDTYTRLVLREVALAAAP